MFLRRFVLDYSMMQENSSKRILAIETSCDETSIALLEVSGEFPTSQFKVLGHIVSSQAKLHTEYGGVFPQLAKKEHSKNLPILLEQILKESNLFHPKNQASSFYSKILTNLRTYFLKYKLKKLLIREPDAFEKTWEIISSLENPDIDYIAVTFGPGLPPALWAGINFAKALSTAWDIPVIPTHHMKGHIWSIFASGNEFPMYEPQFPILVLLVSGGHTQLVLVESFTQYRLLGESLDDAVGEAFDKVARTLGLSYPGGPHIEKMAREATSLNKIKLPRPMLNTDDYNFSFAGIKTAVLYMVRDLTKKDPKVLENKEVVSNIAHEFQTAVTDVLVKKTARAIAEFQPSKLIISGGVSANNYIRGEFEKLHDEYGTEIVFPSRELTGDNALMIGVAGYIELSTQMKSPDRNLNSIRAQGRVPL